MVEFVESLGDALVFSTLDASGTYWQIESDNEDREKTASTIHHGLYKFIRMPYGLKNAQPTFQRVM